MPSLERALFDHLKARGLWTNGSVLGDDAAIIPFPASNLVVSADMLTEGVDFLLGAADPQWVGRKSLAVNLSDLAAMAAVPDGFTVSLALPQIWPARPVDSVEQTTGVFGNLSALEYLKRFYDGVLQLADEFNVPLIGGDTNTFQGPLTIAVSIFGHIEGPLKTNGELANGESANGELTNDKSAETMRGTSKPEEQKYTYSPTARFHAPGASWLRSSAKPGDQVLITGPVGGSILKRQFLFTPRIQEALYLRKNRIIHAAMDISDGLTLDLSRMAEQSNVGIRLNLAAVPIHPDVYRLPDILEAEDLRAQDADAQNADSQKDADNLTPVSGPLSHALSDGEDFELILTAAPDEARKIVRDKEYRARFGQTPIIIGEVFEGEGLWAGNQPLFPHGFEHQST